jgi:hypothetical protein
MTNRLPTPSPNKTNTPDSKKDYISSERQIDSDSDVLNSDRLASPRPDATAAESSETLLDDEDFLNSLLQVEGHHLRGGAAELNTPDSSADRLRRINADWNFTYGCVHDRSGTCNCDTREEAPRVRFSRPETWTRVDEDPELACDLREARRSDLLQRRADRERLERLIAPVLAPEHRRKVYQRMQQQHQRSEEEGSVASAASSFNETSGQQDFTLSNMVCRD